MVNLTTLRDMFLVSYSILFGIMLNTCMGLGLFFFGWIWDKKGNFNIKPLVRILTAFFFINFLPFVYFALIFDWLGTINNDPTFFQIIGTFSLSLFVFGIYRVFHLIIKIFKDKLYGSEICEKEYHGVRNRLDAIGPSVKGQIVSIIIYVLIALLGAYWIKGNQAFHDLYGWFIPLSDYTILYLIILICIASLLAYCLCARETMVNDKESDEADTSKRAQDILLGVLFGLIIGVLTNLWADAFSRVVFVPMSREELIALLILYTVGLIAVGAILWDNIKKMN